MDIVWIAVSALGGGTTAALLGWLESQESFVPKKFMGSVVRALVAAVGFAVGYSYANGVTGLDIAIAFCGGAGFDMLGKTAIGAVRAGISKGSTG